MIAHTLVDHGDIQKWVTSQHGRPALSRFADASGSMHARLEIDFEHHRDKPDEAPGIDDGIAPCSWTAWLAELDRQNLALRVMDSDYEFVDRHSLN